MADITKCCVCKKPKDLEDVDECQVCNKCVCFECGIETVHDCEEKEE